MHSRSNQRRGRRGWARIYGESLYSRTGSLLHEPLSCQGGVCCYRYGDQGDKPRTGQPAYRTRKPSAFSREAARCCFFPQGMPDFGPPQHLIDALCECSQEARNHQYTRSQVGVLGSWTSAITPSSHPFIPGARGAGHRLGQHVWQTDGSPAQPNDRRKSCCVFVCIFKIFLISSPQRGPKKITSHS